MGAMAEPAVRRGALGQRSGDQQCASRWLGRAGVPAPTEMQQAALAGGGPGGGNLVGSVTCGAGAGGGAAPPDPAVLAALARQTWGCPAR
jgi:hypothetical protein